MESYRLASPYHLKVSPSPAPLTTASNEPYGSQCAHLPRTAALLLIKTDWYTMIADSILQFTDLQELCRPCEKPRLSTVERWATSQGIKYRYDGKGGIWTTIDALNSALGVFPLEPDAHYRVEDLF